MTRPARAPAAPAGLFSALFAALSAAVGPAALVAPPAAAQAPQAAGAPPAAGPCALTGSESVFVEGAGMLRLGDVAGCPGVRYEVIPGVLINGQPAVRLLPSEDCAAPGGADGVFVGDGPAARRGDQACR